MKKLSLAIKVIIVSVFMFIGAAYSMIAYNSDTGAQEIQQTIADFFQVSDPALFVGIPYSVGVAIGIVIFMGLFTKKVLPGTLAYDLFEYKQKLQTYKKEGRQL